MIASYLTGLKGCLDEVSAQDICGVAEVIYQASGRGSNIYLFGNGGSASTATHFACDLAKAATLDGTPRVRASSLCDNLALLPPLANDVGY